MPRASLRSLLIGINLVVLVLPLAGIQLMRLYESALVRQTESALIAQAAFVAAFYRSFVKEQGNQDWLDISRELPQATAIRDGRWVPQPATLDLAASPTLPPFPDGRPGDTTNAFTRHAGERITPVLKDAQFVTLAGIRVVDPWGTIIASTGDDVGLSISHTQEIEQALAGLPASRIRKKSEVVEASALDSISRANSIRVFVAYPIVLHQRLIGAVMLSRTPPGIVQALYGKRWLLLQGLILLIGLVVLMSLLTFRLIARPISRLADQASRIATGELSSAKIPADEHRPHTIEIARLQDAITHMATTLEQRASYLQDFSHHVSHEFKTPIAGIRGAIEVLQDHGEDMDDAQRQRFLGNIAADAQRLHRLTERLMELTHAEINIQLAQPVEIRATVHDAASGFIHQLSFKTDGIPASSSANSNVEVLQAVLEILFENAAQHGASEVTLWVQTQQTGVELFVQDNGRGISASNAEQIFTPFFTTQREDGGTGLGLTIAQALIKQVHGTLAIVSDNGPTTFRMTLPR